jgi:RimJ/RimL family protein N-acetyltransferase
MTAEMQFRRADAADCLDLLAWRNDPVSVAASLTGSSVKEADHRTWFARVCAAPDHILLIAERDGEKIGMVRFDRAGEEWEVSINLAPQARGRGLASRVLSGGISAAFPSDRPRPLLIARVKRDNPASWRIFGTCGFVEERVEDELGWFRLDPSPSSEPF